jgi:hypothetical protein
MSSICGQWKDDDELSGCMNLTAITVVATLFYHNTNPPLSIICAGDL